MKGGKMPRGYTIVEVMIVLAVSAALFLIATVAVNGHIAKAEYTQAIRDLESQVIDVANDVSTGYFPSYNNLSCTVAGNVPSIVTGTNTQGTNQNCIFIGKAIQFNDDNTIEIYTLVGNRRNGSSDVTQLSQVYPQTHSSLVEKKTLLYGIKPGGKFSANGSAWATGPSTIVFMTSFAKSAGSSVAGTPKTDLYYLAGSVYSNRSSIEGLLNVSGSEVTTNVYQPITSGFTVCMLKDQKWSALSLGVQNSNLTTRVLRESTGC